MKENFSREKDLSFYRKEQNFTCKHESDFKKKRKIEEIHFHFGTKWKGKEPERRLTSPP